MADKLLIVATVSVLTLPGLGLMNKLPVWLTILIISRDLLIVLTVAVINLAIGRREFRPSIYGKIATATYIVTCVIIMYFNYLQRPSIFVAVGIYASAAITLISGFHYVVHGHQDHQSELNHETTKPRNHEDTKTRRHEDTKTRRRTFRLAATGCIGSAGLQPCHVKFESVAQASALPCEVRIGGAGFSPAM